MKTIAVQGVSKEFLFTRQRLESRNIRDLIHWRHQKPASAAPTFLALDEINFEAHAGEVIGILGRNGAGKSTLLKVLSRILRPTKGRIELNGRVGSLLEVGSGFHPELTGRENVFLNAAILGMTKREIYGKLDQIVDFAGITTHLDEPVKTYSSGMYLRLAFAVAAHIEPEILLIDEVLAVGDAEFQKKSMKRIEEIGTQRQTVLFVSHNMQAIMRLCSRALLLDRGKVVASGPVPDVVAAYLQIDGGHRGERHYPDGPYAPGSHVARLRGIRVRSCEGQTLSTVSIGEKFGIEMQFEVMSAGSTLYPTLSLYNEWGTEVFLSTDVTTEWHGRPRPAGWYTVTAWVPPNLLREGLLNVTAAIYSFQPYFIHFKESDVVSFQTVESSDGINARGNFIGYIGGVVRPLLDWTVHYEAIRTDSRAPRE